MEECVLLHCSSKVNTFNMEKATQVSVYSQISFSFLKGKNELAVMMY